MSKYVSIKVVCMTLRRCAKSLIGLKAFPPCPEGQRRVSEVPLQDEHQPYPQCCPKDVCRWKDELGNIRYYENRYT